MNKCQLASPLSDCRLKVIYGDHTTVILNLSSIVEQRESYWRLKQKRYFDMVKIDPLGGLCWPEGEDLCPDGLSRYQEK